MDQKVVKAGKTEGVGEYAPAVVDLEDVQGYIREQLEDIIYVLGLQVSFRVNRGTAVKLIREAVMKLQ